MLSSSEDVFLQVIMHSALIFLTGKDTSDIFNLHIWMRMLTLTVTLPGSAGEAVGRTTLALSEQILWKEVFLGGQGEDPQPL